MMMINTATTPAPRATATSNLAEQKGKATMQ